MGMIGNTLAVGLVSGANIVDGTVDTSDIKDSAVTNAKIASGVDASKLTAGTLPIDRIADGAVTAAKLSTGAAVTNIGYTPQQADAMLTALAALITSADKLPYFTDADTVALTSITSFMRSLLDDADAATARGTLGLGSLATVSPSGSGNSSTFLRGDGSWQTPVAGLTQISYSQAGSGYLRLSNGFMIQWGITGYIADYGRAFQSFPTSFPNGTFSVVTQNVDSEDSQWMDNLRVYDLVVSGFTMFRRGNNSRNWFIAIGY